MQGILFMGSIVSFPPQRVGCYFVQAQARFTPPALFWSEFEQLLSFWDNAIYVSFNTQYYAGAFIWLTFTPQHGTLALNMGCLYFVPLYWVWKGFSNFFVHNFLKSLFDIWMFKPKVLTVAAGNILKLDKSLFQRCEPDFTLTKEQSMKTCETGITMQTC